MAGLPDTAPTVARYAPANAATGAHVKLCGHADQSTLGDNDMAASAEPSRGRAASPSLRYEQRPGKRSAREGQRSGKSYAVFGCLVFLSCTALLILFALADMFWGDDTWQWAADTSPGGAYGFAAFRGRRGRARDPLRTGRVP